MFDEFDLTQCSMYRGVCLLQEALKLTLQHRLYKREANQEQHAMLVRRCEHPLKHGRVKKLILHDLDATKLLPVNMHAVNRQHHCINPSSKHRQS